MPSKISVEQAGKNILVTYVLSCRNCELCREVACKLLGVEEYRSESGDECPIGEIRNLYNIDEDDSIGDFIRDVLLDMENGLYKDGRFDKRL